jgi:hypothetical protein
VINDLKEDSSTEISEVRKLFQDLDEKFSKEIEILKKKKKETWKQKNVIIKI